MQSAIRRELELCGEGGRVPAPALRVGFLSPSRAGRGGAFRVPRSSRRAGAWGRGVAAAAAAGGSRLSLGSGVGDGGVEAAVSARLGVSRRRRLKNWELGTRAPDLLPPPSRCGRCCRRPEPKAPGPGESGGRLSERAGGRVGDGADPGAGPAVSRRWQSTTFLRFSPRGRTPAAAPDATTATAAALPAAALLPALW